MKIKLRTYCTFTILLTSFCFAYSFCTHKSFYEAISSVYENELFSIVLANFCFMTALVSLVLIKNVFFGQLTGQEIDTITEQSKWSFLNSFMIITMFTDELNSWTIFFILFLIFIKIFHWIVNIRIDSAIQLRNERTRKHLKMLLFILLLTLVDICSMRFFSRRLEGNSSQSIFSISVFEFSVLFVSAVYYSLKYGVNLKDTRHDGRWRQKPLVTFILRSCYLAILAALHLLFVVDITINYGLPVYLIRDIYILFLSLKSCVKKYFNYRRLLREMHNSFSDVRGGEFGETDRTCVICRDDMVVGKRLPCRHVFHFECLQSWFERQNVCPTCRAVVRMQNNLPSAAAPPQNNDQVEAVPISPEGHNQVEADPTTPTSRDGSSQNSFENPFSSSTKTNNTIGDSKVTIPLEHIETQTLILQEHALAAASHSEKMQKILRKQLELLYEVNKNSRRTQSQEQLQTNGLSGENGPNNGDAGNNDNNNENGENNNNDNNNNNNNGGNFLVE